MAVPFFRHDLDATWAAAVAEVLATPFLTSGQIGRGVEAQLCAFFDCPHALLTNSWTNGAVAVLLALGIGPGDEVIVPAMTFIATANAVELVGARPVFVDVAPDTLLMTPEAVQDAVGPATRAVIPVHLYGQMADIVGMRAVLSGRPDIAIIEDAAHCFEGTRDGDPPGRHSDAAIFSFYATKNVTCGEGGAIITRRDDLAEAIQRTRLHGMSAGAIDRFRGSTYRHWDMPQLGTKANLPDLLAALLPRQIASVRDRLERRERLALRYEAALEGRMVRLPRRLPNILHARHLFAIAVAPDRRDRVLARLGEHGIGTTVNYRAVPTMRYYEEKYGLTGRFPVAEAWGNSTLSLPLYPSLTDAEQDEVIMVLRDHALGDDTP